MRASSDRSKQARRSITALLMTAGLLCCFGVSAADNGQDEFDEYCSVCHSVVAGKVKVGPSLSGVVGRKAGSMEGFAYSDALKASGLNWTPEVLDQWLTNPARLIPGTRMTFAGASDAAARRTIIEYLQSVK